MAEVTKEMLFQELQRLQSRLDDLQLAFSETANLLRTTNTELAEGRTRIEEQKRRHRA